MSGRKKSGKEVSIVRSSAAEYLTFIAASGTGGIDAVYDDENIWLTQKMMGVLYVDVRTINYHLPPTEKATTPNTTVLQQSLPSVTR